MQPRDGTPEAQERLERFIEVQQLLFEVSREIGPALELQPVLEVALKAMRRLVDFKGGSICLVEKGTVRLMVSDPEVSPDVKDLRLPVGEGLAGLIVATGEPLYSPNLREDDRVIAEVHQTGSNVTIASYMGVPLVVLGEVIGLLQVDSAETDAFTQDDLYVLSGLGTLVAGAIESARRYEAMLELEQLKNDFIARVSHELRTPITVMSGFARTLRDYGDTLPEQDRREFVGRLSRSAARLQDLVEEVLSLTELDAELRNLRYADTAVHDVIRDAVASTEQPEQLEVDCPPNLVVVTDPALLDRLLTPLLRNALTYAGGGTVRARREGEQLVLDIEDRGPGIPDDLRERMFEQFVRGEHTAPGMGLGLSIVAHVVAALEGQIDYQQLDPGSRFHIRLPVPAAAQATTGAVPIRR